MANTTVRIKIKGDTSDVQGKVQQLIDTMDKLGNSGQGQSKKQATGWKRVGQVMAKAFSVKKILDFEKSALQTTASFQHSMSTVKSLTQANSDQFAQLTAKAREMGEATIYTAKDAADAMGVMARMGWETKELLAGIQPVMDLSIASNEDLARSSDIVVTSMKAFNLGTDKASHVSNTFAKIQAKTGTNLNQLGEAMKYVAPVAYQMGMDIDTASKYIGILADNAIQGSMAGTTLRTTFSRLANPVGDAAKGIAKFTELTGIAIPTTAKVQDKIELLAKGWEKLGKNQRIQVAEMIAGKPALPGFLTLMDNYYGKMKRLDGIMKDNTITAHSLAEEQQNNLYGAIKNLESAWESLQLSFMTGQSQVLQDIIRGIAKTVRGLSNELEYVGKCMDLAYKEVVKPTIQWILDKLGELGIKFAPMKKFFSETLGKSKQFQKTLGLLVLGFVTLGVILLPLLGTLSLLRGAFKLLGIGKLALKVADLAKWFGGLLLEIDPVLAIFAVLGVCIAELAIHWDEVTAWLSEKWQAFHDKLVGWLDDENAKLQAWQDETGEEIAQVCSHIGDLIKEWWNGKSAGEEFCDQIVSDFKEAKQAIGEAIDKIKNWLRNMFNVKISLPHIPTPHFEKVGQFSLNPPQVPSFHFAGWKAQGAIFNKPTMVGNYGVGDAVGGHGSNSEAVLPIDELPNLLGLPQIHSTLNELRNGHKSIYLNIDGRTLAQATYNEFDRVGGDKLNLAGRGIR